MKRFQNGAVIKIVAEPNLLEVKLVHSGELEENKPERKYYVNRIPDSKPDNYTPELFYDYKFSPDGGEGAKPGDQGAYRDTNLITFNGDKINCNMSENNFTIDKKIILKTLDKEKEN